MSRDLRLIGTPRTAVRAKSSKGELRMVGINPQSTKAGGEDLGQRNFTRTEITPNQFRAIHPTATGNDTTVSFITRPSSPTVTGILEDSTFSTATPSSSTIAAIVLGVVLFLVIIIAGMRYFLRQRKRRLGKGRVEQEMPPGNEAASNPPHSMPSELNTTYYELECSVAQREIRVHAGPDIIKSIPPITPITPLAHSPVSPLDSIGSHSPRINTQKPLPPAPPLPPVRYLNVLPVELPNSQPGGQHQKNPTTEAERLQQESRATEHSSKSTRLGKRILDVSRHWREW